MIALFWLCLLLTVTAKAQEYQSGDVQFNTDSWWQDSGDRIMQITAANYEELIVRQPD